MVSFESTDGTNSLLMKSPVETLIVLPVLGTVISAVGTGIVVSNVRKSVVRWGARATGQCWER